MNHQPAASDPHGSPQSAPPLDRPRISVRIEEALAALAMALICLITFANVVVRYLTDASFAFTEEFSVFLLVVLTLVGAAAAFARDRNIRVTFFTEKLSARAQRGFELLGLALAAVLFALVAWTGMRILGDDWKYGTTSPGIGIPQWIYSLWLPVLAVAVALRAFGRAWRIARRRGTGSEERSAS